MKKGISVFLAVLLLGQQTMYINAEEPVLTGTEETAEQTETADSEINEEMIEETAVEQTVPEEDTAAEQPKIIAEEETDQPAVSEETVIDEESEEPEETAEEPSEPVIDEEPEDTEAAEEETEQPEEVIEEETEEPEVPAEESSETVIDEETEVIEEEQSADEKTEDEEDTEPEIINEEETDDEDIAAETDAEPKEAVDDEEPEDSEVTEEVIEEKTEDKKTAEKKKNQKKEKDTDEVEPEETSEEDVLSHNYAIVKKPSYTGAEKMVYLSANGSTPLSDKDIRAWADQLRSKKATAAAMVRSMLWDLVKKNPSISNTDFVKKAYQTVMQREADAGGLNKNVSALNGGASYDYVIAALTNSAEFANLCSSYHVEKGRVSLSEARDSNLNVTRFVTRLYQNCLERKPDTGGLNNWCRQINAGRMTAADVVKSFFNSTEMNNRNLSNKALVRLAYRTMLDREPDSSGNANWTGCLDAGMTRNAVLQGFVGSQEFLGLCRNYGVIAGRISVSEPRDMNARITKFVARLYRNCFGRRYDVSGLNNWTKQLNAHAVSGAQIAYAFYSSQEMNNLGLNNKEYIKALYRGVLGREAKSSEVSWWAEKMAGGTSRSQMIMNFVYSPEFKSLCGSYGITVGQALSYNVPFYTQTDSRWSGTRFGAWTLGESGCSPTSIAMALSGALNRSVLPNEVGSWLYNNTQEYNRIICGSSGAAIPAAVSAWNASSKAIGTIGDLKAELARGKVIVLYVNYQYIGTPVQSNTHSIVLYGSSGGKTYVRDPGMPWKNGWYSIDTLWSQRSTDSYDLRGGYVSYSVMR